MILLRGNAVLEPECYVQNRKQIKETCQAKNDKCILKSVIFKGININTFSKGPPTPFLLHSLAHTVAFSHAHNEQAAFTSLY